MWCIPSEHDGAFVARMEHVLEVYARSYDARFPVVCMDEQPFQLLSEARSPVPLGAGRGRAVDYEYVREGTCTVWMFVEPLGCWRDVRVTSRRTALAWGAADSRSGGCTALCGRRAHHAGVRQSEHARTSVPCTRHSLRSRRNGSWIVWRWFSRRNTEVGSTLRNRNSAVLTRQSLADRLGSESAVEDRVMPWTQERNRKQIGVDWQFTTQDARTKLKRLYPKIET